MIRARRTGLFAPLLAAVLAVVMFGPTPGSMGARLQDSAIDVIEAGSGPLSEPSFALVARGDFSGAATVYYGFLTAVSALQPNELFIDGARDVRSARLTFVAEVAVAETTNRADVTTTTGAGELRVYFNPAAGASWDDASSFAAGELVAEWTVELRDTLQRQAPGVGVIVADGQITQTLAGSFAIDDLQVRFGHEGLRQRLRLVGAQMAGPNDDLTMRASLKGTAFVSDREAISVVLGLPPETDAAATPAARAPSDECSALQSWLALTRDGVRQTLAAEQAIGSADVLESLDAGALRQTAGEMAVLAAAQRAATAPEGADDAKRLVVTALSTYARGLQAMASAAETGDADLLQQGLGARVDGASLLARAAAAVDALEVEAGCTLRAQHGMVMS